MSAKQERRGWRIALAAAVFFSWLVTFPLIWRAFSTVPSGERLKQSHMIQIPTLQTLALQLGMSALEVGVLLALLWPWWRRGWVARTWIAAIGLTLYFLMTPPLGVTALNLVHRRWLALMALLLLVSAAVSTISALFRRTKMQ